MSDSHQPQNGYVRLPLGVAPRGFRGRVDAIEAHQESGNLPAEEIENRLLELGFVEGAHVEILHEGAFGRDPIAVRVNNATIALRRREAMAILTTQEASQDASQDTNQDTSQDGPA